MVSFVQGPQNLDCLKKRDRRKQYQETITVTAVSNMQHTYSLGKGGKFSSKCVKLGFPSICGRKHRCGGVYRTNTFNIINVEALNKDERATAAIVSF